MHSRFRGHNVIGLLLSGGTLLVLLSFGGCRQVETALVTRQPATTAERLSATAAPSYTPTFTHTPTQTPTPTDTPTPTMTPTPTPTPTATAPPLIVRGDPRASRLSDPVPGPGAPCGLVDMLDFPLRPPDAAGLSFGGGDFGVFRRRYDKYHAGEDWWIGRGGSSFGQPVHSIGHGTVTYANGDGWGRDQGVVIVRHVFAGGGDILSFYGHLHPPSVTLRPGDCVTRGQEVGTIGRPRSTPHLHFEMRHHLPNTPGPGYWPVDPQLAGWVPPSDTIWTFRNAGAPGVQWTRPITARTAVGLGMLGQDTYLLHQGERLVGIDVADGSLRWQSAGSDSVYDAIVAAGRPILYTANRGGEIHAFDLSSSTGENGARPPDRLWQTDLETSGIPTLMPLPDGGVAVSVRQQLLALSPQGQILWQEELDGEPWAWAADETTLIFSIDRRETPLWTADASGLVQTNVLIRGRPIVAGDRWYLYGDDGFYGLDGQPLTAELLLALPEARPRPGPALVLPDGDILLVHADNSDRRLVRLDPEGQVRWTRSYNRSIQGDVIPFMMADQLFLVARNRTSGLSQTSLYAMDEDGLLLTHFYIAGFRGWLGEDVWVADIGRDLLLFRVAGTGLMALDTGQALAAALPGDGGQ